MELLTPVLVFIAIWVAGAYVARRVAITRLRRQHDAKFDQNGTADIDSLVETVRTALPNLCADAVEIPSLEMPDQRWLDAAVALAAERFDQPLSTLRWCFTREPRSPNAAGCVWRPAAQSIALTGNQAVVSQHNVDSFSWSIEVADRYRQDRETALVIIAHEVAHVALLSRGIKLTPLRRNEELTDVAATLAGFASLMDSVSARERWHDGAKKISLTVGEVGYLHPRAIRYIRDRYLAAAS